MEKKKKTQKEQVLNHLKKNGSITTMVAFNRYSITRLSARIWELRHDGYEITTENETRKGKTYARYRMKGDK